MLKNNGHVTSHMTTTFGTVDYKRTVLIPADPASSEKLMTLENVKSIVPFDDYLGLRGLPSRISIDMMLRISFEAAKCRTLKEACDNLKEENNANISPNTIRKITDYTGSILNKHLEDQVINTLGKSTSKKSHSSKPRRISIVIEYNRTHFFRNSTDDSSGLWTSCIFLSSDKYEMPQRVPVILDEEYVAVYGTSSQFRDRIQSYLNTLEISSEDQVIVISSCSPQIKSFTDEVFPSAIHILDLDSLYTDLDAFVSYLNSLKKFKNQEIMQSFKELLMGKIKHISQQELLQKFEPYKDLIMKLPSGASNPYSAICGKGFRTDYVSLENQRIHVTTQLIDNGRLRNTLDLLRTKGAKCSLESAKNMLAIRCMLFSGRWTEAETVVREYINSGRGENDTQ